MKTAIIILILYIIGYKIIILRKLTIYKNIIDSYKKINKEQEKLISNKTEQINNYKKISNSDIMDGIKY